MDVVGIHPCGIWLEAHLRSLAIRGAAIVGAGAGKHRVEGQDLAGSTGGCAARGRGCADRRTTLAAVTHMARFTEATSGDESPPRVLRNTRADKH